MIAKIKPGVPLYGTAEQHQITSEMLDNEYSYILGCEIAGEALDRGILTEQEFTSVVLKMRALFQPMYAELLPKPLEEKYFHDLKCKRKQEE